MKLKVKDKTFHNVNVGDIVNVGDLQFKVIKTEYDGVIYCKQINKNNKSTIVVISLLLLISILYFFLQ